LVVTQVVDFHGTGLAHAREASGENQRILRIPGSFDEENRDFRRPALASAARVIGCRRLEIPKKIPTGEWSGFLVGGGAGGI